MRRIEPLDWQRGLLAFAIMIYHLTGWHYRHPDAATVLGRLGIYGVTMFFVLSGLSMALVYSNFILDGRTSIAFFVRRIFRIWPLLWVAVTVATAGGVLLNDNYIDWSLILLNLTTLFGFVSPGAYVNTGAWSIGNEMVYYALTPALIWIYNRRIAYGNLVFAATAVIGAYFAFYALSSEAILAAQWNTYINPFNRALGAVDGKEFNTPPYLARASDTGGISDGNYLVFVFHTGLVGVAGSAGFSADYCDIRIGELVDQA